MANTPIDRLLAQLDAVGQQFEDHWHAILRHVEHGNGDMAELTKQHIDFRCECHGLIACIHDVAMYFDDASKPVAVRWSNQRAMQVGQWCDVTADCTSADAADEFWEFAGRAEFGQQMHSTMAEMKALRDEVGGLSRFGRTECADIPKLHDMTDPITCVQLGLTPGITNQRPTPDDDAASRKSDAGPDDECCVFEYDEQHKVLKVGYPDDVEGVQRIAQGVKGFGYIERIIKATPNGGVPSLELHAGDAKQAKAATSDEVTDARQSDDAPQLTADDWTGDRPVRDDLFETIRDLPYCEPDRRQEAIDHIIAIGGLRLKKGEDYADVVLMRAVAERLKMNPQQADSATKAVRQALDRAYAKLAAADFARLSKHLKANIKYEGLAWYYDPASPMDWA